MSARPVVLLRIAAVLVVAGIAGYLLMLMAPSPPQAASIDPSPAPSPGTRPAAIAPSAPVSVSPEWLVTGRTRTIVHRGGTPDGTVEGCMRSLDAGITFLELDVRLTADGAAVILHDTMLDRTTSGKGMVEGKSLEEVRALKVPTVAEVLHAVGGRGVVLLELKVPGAWKAVMEAIRREDAFNRTVVRAMDEATLRSIRTAEPRILLGTRGSNSDVAYLRNLGVVAFTPNNNNNLSADSVWSLHAAGIAVWGTNTDDPAVWSWLIDIGVDGIITDKPADLQVRIR